MKMIFSLIVAASAVFSIVSLPNTVVAAIPKHSTKHSTKHSAKNSPPKYQVNLRVGLKGVSPFSVNTVAKPGKKAFISEISPDGQNETLVEVIARKSQQKNKSGLLMDVTVTRRVRGHQKLMERAQFFAPENEEMEVGVNAKGRNAGNLSLAIMAHEI